ncbi:MAG TPA: hypothetical protein VFH44_04115 [Solirubrobacterales bacterium]|nr:hypothetical protein [Solirubrobacterales bacterium]
MPGFARPFVAVMIALMLACAVFVWEPWPFTSFRLFSNLRLDHQTAWSATTVDRAGNEDPYPLGAEDHGFRGFPFTMVEFTSAPAERQDELCRLWVEAAPELVGRDAVAVRIYRRSWDLSSRAGDAALPGERTLEYVCRPSGVTGGS